MYYHPITEPNLTNTLQRCWRANLQAKLRNDGVNNFDFVGGQTGKCAGNPDQDHEGHPGSLATDFAKNGNLVGWLDAAKPDVIVMLLGTNDVLLGKKPVDEILGAYNVLLGQMRDNNPNMRIVFSNLLPLDPARWTQDAADNIVKLNAAIASYAPSKSTEASPVVFVDNFDGFDPVADTDDGEHPNDGGNEKMATKFFAPTRDFVQAVASVTKRRASLFERRVAQPKF
jgi:lysophospholipase L1-like esterase